MQTPSIDSDSTSFYDEYKRVNPETGEQQPISFQEKEKLYLECLDAFYNEGGKQLLPDDEYEQLKNDLNFEGSTISTLSKDEIRFVLANKRYAMGKPILSDEAYDALRLALKFKNSPVVLHEAPSCTVDGICKLDLRIDNTKQRLLYLPGILLSGFFYCNLLSYITGCSPFLALLLGALPTYFSGAWFTENIFCQKPQVTTTNCPNCNYGLTVYFGDVLNVMTEGYIAGGPPGPLVDVNCPSCKAQLVADRNKMIIITKEPKGQKVEA